MEITITWTKLLVLFAGYHTLRYLYHTYMKWVTGCTDVLDPFIPFDVALSAEYKYLQYRYELRTEQEKTARLNAELALLKYQLKDPEATPPRKRQVKQARK